MNRQEKSEFVASFNQQVIASPLVVVAGYVGTAVNTSNRMRRELEESGVRLRIVKNSLARRALVGTGLEGLEPFFTGMTLVATTGEDVSSGAKAIKSVFAGVQSIEVRAGYFEGEVVDPAGVKALADLPSREELLVSLLRTIQEPARRVLGVLQAPARDLLYLLKNYENKLSEAEGE